MSRLGDKMEIFLQPFNFNTILTYLENFLVVSLSILLFFLEFSKSFNNRETNSFVSCHLVMSCSLKKDDSIPPSVLRLPN